MIPLPGEQTRSARGGAASLPTPTGVGLREYKVSASSSQRAREMACRGPAGDCNGDGSCGRGDAAAGVDRGPPSSSTLLGVCCKCKERQAHTKANQTEQVCGPCLRASLFSKFKLAVTSYSMISPSDAVLVAFSGGPSSRYSHEPNPPFGLVLEFVHEMQSKAYKNLQASRDRSLPVFHVGVAFVDEDEVYSLSEGNNAIEELRMIVSSLAPPIKAFHAVSISSACSAHCNEIEGRKRFSELLQSIGDATGKEDFLRYLRMLLLQKIARENGYNKLVLGLCASRLACNVISATKGQGYSLPADLQYVDARWGIPIVLPLRDCVLHEITTICHLDSLKTLELTRHPPPNNINSLVSSFVTKLQEENPSREGTILRTGEKLCPFLFNKLPDTGHEHLSFRRRHALEKFNSSGSISSDFLCPICSSPVSETDLVNIKSHSGNSLAKEAFFRCTCCPSCLFQILPKEESSMDRFYALLPNEMIVRAKLNGNSEQSWLREKIEDCLLLDDHDRC